MVVSQMCQVGGISQEWVSGESNLLSYGRVHLLLGLREDNNLIR